jgi:hypothetical protein
MKRLFITGLSIMTISLIASIPAQASGRTEVTVQIGAKVSSHIPISKYVTPFDLVGGAYQGQYRSHSIPGFASLLDGARTGKIAAKDLVKAAIESERLLPETIDDRNYLRSVEVQLRSIGR